MTPNLTALHRVLVGGFIAVLAVFGFLHARGITPLNPPDRMTPILAGIFAGVPLFFLLLGSLAFKRQVPRVP